MSQVRKFIYTVAFAAFGVLLAFGGSELALWSVLMYPSYDQIIRALAPWVIGFSVCILSIYPILRLHGIIRPN